MRTEFIAQNRVKAPIPEKQDRSAPPDTSDADNWRLVRRDLEENPTIWPLPSFMEAIR